MFDFCQAMYNLHAPIEMYVPYWISKDEYKQITGKDYVAA